jgi:hypothetical protein
VLPVAREPAHQLVSSFGQGHRQADYCC